MKVTTREEYRVRRHKRLRNKVKGDAQRPRMSVFVSNKNMYVQFVDDVSGATLAQASTQGEGLSSKGLNVETAKQLGVLAAQRIQEKGVRTVVFDRGGFTYHGRVRAIAEGAREAGLEF